MKSKLTFAFLSLFLLNSCYSTGGVTGQTMMGAVESRWWFNNAPRQDINYFYDKFSTSELCIRWQRFYPGTHQSTNIRTEISRALERRGENGLRCYDGNMDNQSISNAKIKDAEQKAEQRIREAEAIARAANNRAHCLKLAAEGKTKVFYCNQY